MRARLTARDLKGAIVTGVMPKNPRDYEASDVLEFMLPDGRRVICGVWRDEEGNGPGFLNLEEWDGPDLGVLA